MKTATVCLFTILAVLFLKSLLGAAFPFFFVPFIWILTSVFSFKLGDLIFEEEPSLTYQNLFQSHDAVCLWVGLILGPILFVLIIFNEWDTFTEFFTEKCTIQWPIHIVRKK